MSTYKEMIEHARESDAIMSMPLGNRPAPASWLPILNPTGLLLLPEPPEPPDLAFAAAAPASLDEAIIAPARVGEGVGVGRLGRLGEGGGMPGAVVENADIFQSETILTNGPLPLKLGNPFGEKSGGNHSRIRGGFG